jgi:hypothetical protein
MNDNGHDLITGPYREKIIKQLTLNIIAEVEGDGPARPSPREALCALSRAMGMVIGASFSPLMHDGVFAACLDQMAGWSKLISK